MSDEEGAAEAPKPAEEVEGPKEEAKEEPQAEEQKTDETKTEEQLSAEPKIDDAKTETEEKKPEEQRIEPDAVTEEAESAVKRSSQVPEAEIQKTEDVKSQEATADDTSKPEVAEEKVDKRKSQVGEEPSEDKVEEPEPGKDIVPKASIISKTSKERASMRESTSFSHDKARASIAISSESLGKKGRTGSYKEEMYKESGRKSRTERLNSKAQKVLGSTISIRRLSNIGEFYDRAKGARFMNSYRLDSDNPFNPDKVTKILEAVMIEALENLTYDPDKCPKQAKWASSAIRAKVKELQFDRYKLICIVTIGEKNSQDVLVTCRFLWDVDRDRYATYCIENTYVFGIAQCFGVYYE